MFALRASARGVELLPHAERRSQTCYIVGLVDIMQPWDLAKWVEYLFRGALYGREAISAVPPPKYRTRFLDFVQAIFDPPE